MKSSNQVTVPVSRWLQEQTTATAFGRLVYDDSNENSLYRFAADISVVGGENAIHRPWADHLLLGGGITSASAGGTPSNGQLSMNIRLEFP